MADPNDIHMVVVSIVAAALSGASVVGCDRGTSEREAQSNPAAPSTDRPGVAATGRMDPSSERHFSTRVRPDEITVGDTSEAALEIRPDDGLKINEEYPSWTLELETPGRAELSTRSYRRDDFELESDRAVVQAEISVSEPGTTEVDGTATFSVCNDETCHILRDEPVSFRVEATGKDGSVQNPEGEGQNGR